MIPHRLPAPASGLDEVYIPTLGDVHILDDTFDVPFPTSGGAPNAIVRSPGHRRKLCPAERDNQLPLAATTSNLIDLDRLAGDCAELKETLSLIRDPEAFTSLFGSDTPEPRKHRPLSKMMLQHEADLLRYDVVEPFVPPEDLLLGQAFATNPALAILALTVWIVCFLVPKKDNTGRFIADARCINRSQKRPGSMGLPMIGAAIRQILSMEVAAKADGVGYFYQFGLHPHIRPFFKMRLCQGKGRYSHVQLKRMPMGWSHSPRIAQQVSNHIVRGCGLAWLDDFIIGGRRDEFTTTRATFLSRINRYNVQLDDATLQPKELFDALGLQFDLALKRFRLAPKWVEARRREVTDFVEASESGETTYRSFFKFMGVCIWASHVRERPLWCHAEALACLSQAARACEGDYDSPFTVPQYALADLKRWSEELWSNEWCTPSADSATQTSDVMFSDASNTHGAYLRVLDDIIVACDGWQRTDDSPIFMGELLALLKGAQSSAADTLLVTDNQALHYALRKGHSSSYHANTLLRSTFGLRRPESRWISTTLQPADRFTRGMIPLVTPCAVDDITATALASLQVTPWGTDLEANKPV
jgi:hypothetical protein